MRLSRTLSIMAAFLLAVAAVAVWLLPRLESAFLANPLLNAVLVAVWLAGIAYIVAQTLRLLPEIRWVAAVQRSWLAANERDPPPLMGSLARLMEDNAGPLILTPTALRAVLDGIAVRLDENRETARYLTGLMIFLGLLGTFWGLLRTVGSVGAVVNGLSMTADPAELFNALKTGLEGPLTGMGTAFSSSLLGLAGSLVLGFLDLQLGQAQNRFFIGLEDWLFASARGGDRGLDLDGPNLMTVQALVAETARSIDRFGQIMLDVEQGRRQAAVATESLIAALGDLTRERNRDSEILAAIEGGIRRIADAQADLRAQAIEEVRGDITRLARTIGVRIGEPGPQRDLR
jgi:hypothetical protein